MSRRAGMRDGRTSPTPTVRAPFDRNRVLGSADQPAWSPDGRWIAYRAVERTSQQSDSGGSIADPGSGLVIVRPDGTGERTIAAPGVGAFVWGPDSGRLLFVRADTAVSPLALWQATLDGAPQRLAASLGASPS